MYRQAGRGILHLCRDEPSEVVSTVDIMVSFYLGELFVKLVMLYILQTLVPPQSTLWTFGRMVVHVEIFRLPTYLNNDQRWKDENLSLHFALFKL